MNWIRVKDRLPEFEKDVMLYWELFTKEKKAPKRYEVFCVGYLVEVRSRKSSDGIVNFPEWHIGEDYDNTSPTHWMPLPEPPKDETL